MYNTSKKDGFDSVPFALCSAIHRPVVCHILEVRLGIAVQDQIHIGQRIVIDQIVELRPFIHIVRVFVFHGSAVDRDYASVNATVNRR